MATTTTSTLFKFHTLYATVTIYDHKLGTNPGVHFHKLCPNRTCDISQYYGYYTTKGRIIFNSNWETLSYFSSSQDTYFSVELLTQLDAHVLIGQISYKQQADIYNYVYK